jgi:lipoic acid synthetase
MGQTEYKSKLPDWLKRRLPAGGKYGQTESVLRSLDLQTICVSASCPNRGQCWERGTATVLILGKICTRNCGFCSVEGGKPAPADSSEPGRVAEMAERMGLKYLVITSVNRDDLADGGAGQFRDCVLEVRRKCPEIRFEILVPDFRGCQGRALELLREALPFVFAHNVETVPSLYSIVRKGADYNESLELLRMAKESFDGIVTKTSFMLGLGESESQVEQVMKDLRGVGCDRITIGQYLKPSKSSIDVVRYVPPGEFVNWKEKALSLGFSWVYSEPFARSSYFAELECCC